MAQLPDNNPPAPENRGPSAIGGLLTVIGTVGVFAGIAVGSKAIVKRLPKQLKEAVDQRVADWAFDSIDKIRQSPTFNKLDRIFVERSGDVNNQVFAQQLREIGARELGLLHDLQVVSRLRNPGADFLENFKKQNLVKYENIPELAAGGRLRATLGDLWDAAQSGSAPENVQRVMKDLDLKQAADKLGLHQQDLLSMRLDPYLFLHRKGGTPTIENLRQLNFPGRALNAIENLRPLGIPFFKFRNRNSADKFGLAHFGRRETGMDEIPHPVVRMITGKDHGELAVLGKQAWYRPNSGEKFSFFKTLDDMALTSDYKMGQLALRSQMSAGDYDKYVLGLGEPKSDWEKFKRVLGVGREYQGPNEHSLLGDFAHMDLDKLADKPGAVGAALRFARRNDPVGFMGGAWKKEQIEGITRGGSGFGTVSKVLGEGPEGIGGVYMRRTGVKGLMDWFNVQATRPYYLVGKMGFNIRPGSNAISSTLKLAGLAAGVYMGKEALSYADWAFGNPVSTAAGKVWGGLNWLRQTGLEATGLRDTFEDIEEETPGVVNSPLSQMLRVGGLALAGAALGKKLGSGRMLKGVMEKMAAGGFKGVGQDVATGIIENQGTAAGAGAAVGGLLLGGLAGLATLGDLTKTPREVGEEMRGERQVDYRASKGWMLGRDPFAGGRIRFYKPSPYHSLGTDYNAVGVYGSEGNKWRYGSWLPTAQNWLGARRLLNPYFAEDRNYHSRPYPVTSGHFGDFPIFGPVLQSTVGSILKPERTRELGAGHTGELAAMNADHHQMSLGGKNFYSGQFTSGQGGFYAPGPGEMGEMGYAPMQTSMGMVAGPNSIVQGAGLSTKMFEEYIGLRGFQAQFFRQAVFGQQNPMLTRPVLAASGKMSSISRSYYDAEPGGLLGTTELVRRFITRPTGQPEINPIPNTMPDWMAGSRSMFEQDKDFYADFGRGDPYTKIPLGEARLPGPGRDALYKKHGGAAYDVVDAFLVSADVQPFTQSYQVLKREVERLIRQGKLEPEWVRRYMIAVEQAERRANFRVYHQRRYRERMNVSIEEVMSATRFRTTSGQVIDLEGTQLDYSEPMKLLAQRQADGMTPSEAMLSVSRDKQRLREMLEGRVGQELNIDVTGMKRGRIQARIPELENTLEEMGVVEEDRLRDQGIVGRTYTGAGKLVGESAFLATAAVSFAKGSGTPAARTLKALVKATGAGIVGGWAENKFTGDFSAVEHYERFQKYGSSFADWTTPYSSFVRNWFNQGLSTVMDYTPIHKQEQYEVEEYFDKLKFIKYQQLERQASAAGAGTAAYEFGKQSRATLTAMDYGTLSANTPGLHESLPANERQYFRGFSREQDPEQRKQILQAVPDYMKSVYLAIWKNELGERNDFEDTELAAQYAKFVAPKINTSADERAEAFFQNYAMPDTDWAGWHPEVNLEDVKYRTVQVRGGSPHEHGLYSSQGKQIDAFMPYMTEVAEELEDVMTRESGIEMLDKIRKMDPKARIIFNTNYGGLPFGNVVLREDDTDRYNAYLDRRAAGGIGIY